MANGWTPERRAKQAQLIHSWRPWEQSTGPRTACGKSMVARNAWQGGQRAWFRACDVLLATFRKHGVNSLSECGSLTPKVLNAAYIFATQGPDKAIEDKVIIRKATIR